MMDEVYILRYGEAILCVASRFERCSEAMADFSPKGQRKLVIECRRVEE